MAAYDIKQHFQGLRVDTGRKKGRDPFATGFEDDESEEERQRSRRRDRSSKPKQAPLQPVGGEAAQGLRPKANPTAPAFGGLPKTSVLDQLRDSDDEWLGARPRRTDRRPSPAPAQLASLRVSDGAGRRGSIDKGLQAAGGKAPRSAIVQAAGQLAYLDDSDDDEALVAPPKKGADRRPSPAPRKSSDSDKRGERSWTPRGTRAPPKELGEAKPSRHTVASAFAGTKYLQDSDSDDETAVSSRKSSADSGVAGADDDLLDPLTPYESARKHKSPDIKRVDKPKQSNGSGVSWRAFSASRTEQRSAEIEALSASLRQRGKSISFGSYAITDDGKRVPVAVTTGLQRKRSGTARGPRPRGKSPPKRAEESGGLAEDDELDGTSAGGPFFDAREFKTSPLTGKQADGDCRRAACG